MTPDKPLIPLILKLNFYLCKKMDWQSNMWTMEK